MSSYTERGPVEWSEQLARIAGHIDELRVRIDAAYQLLYTSLDAQIGALHAELRKLEAEVSATDGRVYARQVAGQIEELRAQGDAAYEMLQSSLASYVDPIDTEIKRLEAIAVSTTGDHRARIMARIGGLRARRYARN